MGLDIKDKRILVCLDEDARISIKHLAKKTRLNQNTAAYRLKRLEQEGYISGYYALIDNSKLGLIGFRVYFRFMDTDDLKEKEIFDYLRSLREIHVLTRNDGVYDAGFMCWVRSIYEFDTVWLKFKQRYKPFIGRHQIAIFTKVHHFSREYILGERTNYDSLIVGGSMVQKIDEVDTTILSAISGNARASLLELSKKTTIPVRTVAFRLKNLERRKIILGYKANINLEKIGYKYYKVNFVLNDLSIIKQLIEFSRQNKYITYIDMTVSLNDFEFDMEVPSREEFHRIISALKQKFPAIRDFEEFTVREYTKLVYF